jgi:hypothetical protein
VCDIHPSAGKWETLTGEGGFGVHGVVDLGMIGSGERDRVVCRIVMEVVVVVEVRWMGGGSVTDVLL